MFIFEYRLFKKALINSLANIDDLELFKEQLNAFLTLFDSSPAKFGINDQHVFLTEKNDLIIKAITVFAKKFGLHCVQLDYLEFSKRQFGKKLLLEKYNKQLNQAPQDTNFPLSLLEQLARQDIRTKHISLIKDYLKDLLFLYGYVLKENDSGGYDGYVFDYTVLFLLTDNELDDTNVNYKVFHYYHTHNDLPAVIAEIGKAEYKYLYILSYDKPVNIDESTELRRTIDYFTNLLVQDLSANELLMYILRRLVDHSPKSILQYLANLKNTNYYVIQDSFDLGFFLDENRKYRELFGTELDLNRAYEQFDKLNASGEIKLYYVIEKTGFDYYKHLYHMLNKDIHTFKISDVPLYNFKSNVRVTYGHYPLSIYAYSTFEKLKFDELYYLSGLLVLQSTRLNDVFAVAYFGDFKFRQLVDSLLEIDSTPIVIIK